jgi:DNA-directed RNA polymerase subunit RPC12/RpoP
MIGRPVEYQSGCALCGKELLYTSEPEEMQCEFCGGLFKSQARCVDRHFVCDACHSLSANDLIQQYTLGSTSADPIFMAATLMKSPSLKMHGPEHHFLVPAVLLSATLNISGRENEKKTKIEKARQRAEKILGGFCGFYGNCGAAVGTGIFMSILTDATPLSRNEWMLSNLLTADSLRSIALAGGPRCCKRNTFLAIEEAIRFVKERFHIEMEVGAGSMKCEFYLMNKECRQAECRFYPL